MMTRPSMDCQRIVAAVSFRPKEKVVVSLFILFAGVVGQCAIHRGYSIPLIGRRVWSSAIGADLFFLFLHSVDGYRRSSPTKTSSSTNTATYSLPIFSKLSSLPQAIVGDGAREKVSKALDQVVPKVWKPNIELSPLLQEQFHQGWLFAFSDDALSFIGKDLAPYGEEAWPDVALSKMQLSHRWSAGITRVPTSYPIGLSVEGAEVRKLLEARGWFFNDGLVNGYYHKASTAVIADALLDWLNKNNHFLEFSYLLSSFEQRDKKVIAGLFDTLAGEIETAVGDHWLAKADRSLVYEALYLLYGGIAKDWAQWDNTVLDKDRYASFLPNTYQESEDTWDPSNVQ
jgi:hypothetical protein